MIEAEYVILRILQIMGDNTVHSRDLENNMLSLENFIE